MTTHPVSVWCLTFNHRFFIQDAIEGVLSQQTCFPVRLFIYDDASTDGTSEIVKEYQRQHPDRIRALIADRNTWNEPERQARLYRKIEPFLSGKYIAWCEGDDFWTDSNKLQQQVSYMETHPECVMTAHASKLMDYGRGETYPYHPYDSERDLLPEEVILQPGGNLTTASLVMRKDIMFREPDYPRADVGDVTAQWYAITKGTIHYFDREMCVYRYAHEGSWQKEIYEQLIPYLSHALKMIVFLEQYTLFTENRYKGIVRKKIRFYLENAMSRIRELPGERVIDLFCEVCADNNERKRYYADELIRLHGIFHEDFNRTLEKYRETVASFRQVVVYGCGRNAVFVCHMLEQMHISWEGFIVSNNQDTAQYKLNKPVWNIRDYPNPIKDVLIVVGVGQQFEEAILEEMAAHGVRHYITPIWYDIRC